VISPMTAICNIEKPSRRRPNGVFDDPFFNSIFRETQRQFIQSDSLKISVIPYPKSPPADFAGAVGKFEVNSWVDTSPVKVNEAITFKVRIGTSKTGSDKKINGLRYFLSFLWYILRR